MASSGWLRVGYTVVIQDWYWLFFTAFHKQLNFRKLKIAGHDPLQKYEEIIDDPTCKKQLG